MRRYNFLFCFSKDLEIYYKEMEDFNADFCRGITDHRRKTILCNLSAKQYKGIIDDLYIINISKTINHEILHMLLRHISDRYEEGEENIVKYLSGQKNEKDCC